MPQGEYPAAKAEAVLRASPNTGMNWVFEQETEAYTSELGLCRGRVWITAAGKWSARVIAPRKEQWAHHFSSTDEAKAWCEQRLHELTSRHCCGG